MMPIFADQRRMAYRVLAQAAVRGVRFLWQRIVRERDGSLASALLEAQLDSFKTPSLAMESPLVLQNIVPAQPQLVRFANLDLSVQTGFVK
jgi:hypothetical protein